MSSDPKVFGDGPRVSSDGTVFSCYTVEWIGEEPPRALRLGDLVYTRVDEPDGSPLRMGGDRG